MIAVNRTQAASYRVLVDGAEVAREQRDRITEIRVVEHLRLPDVCTLQITYPKAEGVDELAFTIGAAIEVRLGAADELLAHTLFRGEVQTLEPEFGAGGCRVLVRAYDRSHVLQRSRRVRTFQNQTTGDIVGRIVAEAGLTARCDVPGEPHEFVQQDNETDWELIWRLADRAGLELVVAGDVAELRRPSADDPIELAWPTSLRSFRPRITAVQQVGEATLRAHDPLTKQTIFARAEHAERITRIGLSQASVASGSMHVATEPVASEAEGRVLAQALVDRLANGCVGAEGVAPGNPRIRAGSTVTVSGIGTSFGGVYRVATAQHVLRDGMYETRFADAVEQTLAGAIGAAGARRASFGSQLVLGIVTNNDDPAGLGRVRLRYPALGDEHESAWARIASASAGEGRGLMMLPVVGEEVVVGFEHDDTRRPYVLGSLFNGVDRPGDELLQGRDGSCALRSGARLYLEARQEITVKGAASLTVEIAGDADERVDGSRASIAGGDAKLAAGRALQLEGQSVAISGTSSVELRCGASSIQLTSAGIAIDGPTIRLG